MIKYVHVTKHQADNEEQLLLKFQLPSFYQTIYMTLKITQKLRKLVLKQLCSSSKHLFGELPL